MRTDSGLGPDGKGVFGSDGHGQLMSQKLAADKWSAVKFQKTPDTLFLTVDGMTVSSKPNRAKVVDLKDFEMEKGTTKLLAGKIAGSGDVGLDGQIGDLQLVEGPSPTPVETVAA